MGGRTATVALVATLLVAGCSSPAQPNTTAEPGTNTAAPEATARSTTAPTTEQAGQSTANDTRIRGNLSFDTEAVRERTEAMLGTDVPPPATIIVRDYRPSEVSPGNGTPFERSLGIVPADDIYANSSGDGAAYPSKEKVYLLRGPETSGAELEYFFVHELTHLAQHEANASDRVGRPDGGNSVLLGETVIEGGAEFAGAHYANEYELPYDPTESLRAEYEGAGAYRRLELAPYYHGLRYIRGRVDAPADLDAVYDDPPRSTEQVLHGYAPDEELPKPLDVRGVTGNGSWIWTDERVHGELFLRIALGSELDEDRAARAAKGWGADSRLTFERGNDTAWAWALRWDDATEADEFRAAFDRFRESHDPPGDSALRSVDVSDETVVVLVGDPAFVGNATVGGTTGEVTVRA